MNLLRKIGIPLLLFCCLSADAQSKEDLIKTIRKNFQSINADTSLRKLTLDEEDFLDNTPDGGAELTGFFRKDSIVKIIEWIGFSYGNRTREFYFKSARLFFVYEKFESFQVNKKGDGLDPSQVKTSFEGRYYFNKGQLLSRRLTGKRNFEDGDALSELMRRASEYVQLLKKK